MYNYFLNTQTIFLLSLKKVNVMKITLLKNYLSHLIGDSIDVSDKRGEYLCRIKTATTNETKPVKKHKNKK